VFDALVLLAASAASPAGNRERMGSLVAPY
jgi:hypothetical protein